MKISLFIDTSTKYLCVGIAKDNKVIYKVQEEALQKQQKRMGHKRICDNGAPRHKIALS